MTKRKISHETSKAFLKKFEKKMHVRRLRMSDYDSVIAVQRSAFGEDIPHWEREHFQAQIKRFSAGQIGVEFEGKLIAVSASLIVNEAQVMRQHTFMEVCDDGMIRNHDPDGEYLYGIDIAVNPEYRGQKLARRLYDARKLVVTRLNLKGMIIGGRIPGYHNHADDMTPEEYCEQVRSRTLTDSVMTAQMSNGFEFHQVLRNYLPEDSESMGHATLMMWENPDYVAEKVTVIDSGSVRVCVVQYQMRPIKKFVDFARQVEYFVDTASDYRSDFVVFPELLTTQLMGLYKEPNPAKAARKLHRYTDRYLDLFADLALRYNVNIIGGTHLILEEEQLYNVAFLFRRDGTIDKQYKVHITPSESKWWGVNAGSKVRVFDTDRGKIAICICYDIEFPEMTRVAAEKGAGIIFVPYNTDMRSGHMRVRYCAQARCVENEVYIVMAGAIGNLPNVEAADIHYSQSCILTPSDIAFDRDGVAAECTPNTEMMLIHDLSLDLLRQHKDRGTTQNWDNRRTDLYRVVWNDGDEIIEV
ncbi:MAG: carbon-nitrogen hydrolase family protein [Rhodospirillales bacterium]